MRLRNLFLLFTSYCLLFSFTGCDIVYRLVQKEGAQEKDILGEIMPFEHNERVEEVQALLKLYGYGIGKVDGKFGNVTRDAIKRFQTDQGLPVTRFVDEQTWAHLHKVKESAFFYDGKLNIEVVQIALKAAGFDPGKPDGKMGKKTLQAVKDFQKEKGLKVDGVVGLNTIDLLSTYVKEVE